MKAEIRIEDEEIEVEIDFVSYGEVLDWLEASLERTIAANARDIAGRVSVDGAPLAEHPDPVRAGAIGRSVSRFLVDCVIGASSDSDTSGDGD